LILNQIIIAATLEYITLASVIVPLVSYLLFCKRKQDIILRVLFFYIVYSSVNDNVLYFVVSERPSLLKLYHFLISLFTVVEFCILAWILYKLNTSRLRRIIISICATGFILFCIITYFTSLKQLSFDSLPASIEAILLLIFCIFYFYEQLTMIVSAPIYQSNSFWIVFSIMVYTSLSFFLFLQSSITPFQIIDNYWDINLVSNILKNIIFAIAFVIKSETPTNRGDMRQNELKFRITPSYKP